MRLEDKAGFVEVLASVCEIYGKAYPSQAVFDLWFSALADFEFAQVKQAFSAYIQGASENSHFMPKPADIVALISGDAEMAAAMAWAKVEGAISSVGQYQSVCFDDARIHAVIELMGGWLKLFVCVDELKWLKKEFINLYMGLRKSSLGEYPSHLRGVAELQNVRNGFRIAPPVPVGDVASAREVYRLGVKAQGQSKGALSAQGAQKLRDFSRLKDLVAV